MLRFFAPITKINEATREVEGVLALEVKDKDGETMDYESSKEHFQQWSDGIFKASGGKSYGNFREMHNPIAAGKAIEPLEFDDVKKTVKVSTKVIEDSTWEKIQEGYLNGFSIGGDYVKKWRDPVSKSRRYTVKPSEGSYVDNPCMYGADFTVIKGNGETEVRKFSGNKDVQQFWACPHSESHHHPTKTEALHCIGDDEEEFQNVEKVEKSYADVSNLSSMLVNGQWLSAGNKDTQKKLSKALAALASVLVQMAKDEKDNLTTTTDDEGVEGETMKVAKGENMEKKKVVEEEEEEEVETLSAEQVKKISEGAVKKFIKGDDFKNVLREVVGEVVEDLQQSVEQLGKTVTKIAESPAPSKIKNVAVSKAADGKKKKVVEEEEEEEEEIEQGKTASNSELMKLMKTALRNPIPLHVVEEEAEEEEE